MGLFPARTSNGSSSSCAWRWKRSTTREYRKMSFNYQRLQGSSHTPTQQPKSMPDLASYSPTGWGVTSWKCSKSNGYLMTITPEELERRVEALEQGVLADIRLA